VDTAVFSIDSKHPDPQVIAHCAKLIQKGETVVFPTETVYGLGADAQNPSGVEKIYKAKGRPGDNPLIVHIADTDALTSLVEEMPETARKLMHAYWPGPLTIIMKKNALLPKAVTAGLETVGIRYPSHPVAQALINESSCAIAAPSANLSGRPSPTTADHVLQDMKGRVAAIILAEDTQVGLESTVLDVTKKPPVIYRPGAITLEMISEIIGDVVLDDAILRESDEKQPLSPGVKYKHYAPVAEMVVVKASSEKVTEKVKKSTRGYQNFGILTVDEHMKDYDDGFIISLGALAAPEEMAHNLYAALRRFDDAGVDIIFAEEIPISPDTLALINRLYRACGFQFL
jgi:L-threonylcarbamoyladenylate synthase